NIKRYDHLDASAVCARARTEADLEKLLDQFEVLYAEVLTGARRPLVPNGAHEDSIARFLHDYLPRRPGDPRWPWLCERETLLEQISLLEAQLGDRVREQEEMQERVRQCEDQFSRISQAYDILKRSHLLRFGRWLRRIRGMPVSY